MCLSSPKAPPPPPPQPAPVTTVEPSQYQNTSPDFEMGLEAEMTAAQKAAAKKAGKDALKANAKKDPGVQTAGGNMGGASSSGVNVNQ